MPHDICIIATTCRAGGAATIFQQLMTTLRKFVEGSLFLTEGQPLSGISPHDYTFHLFVDPSMEQPPLPHVRYLSVDTHGWRRFYFDFWGFRKEVKQRGIKPCVIFSFTNTGVRYDAAATQVVYFQTVLPLVKCRWSPLRRAERSLFFYSGVYPYYTRLLLQRQTEVVLQAAFLAPLFAQTFRHEEQRLHIYRPSLSLPNPDSIAPYAYAEKGTHFFYPSAPYVYKGHFTLLRALATLLAAPQTAALAASLHLHFTFVPADRPDIAAFIEEKGLSKNVHFHGTISFEQVLQMYRSAAAVAFPSEFETQGLPLLEAAAFGLPLLAPDLPYARAVVGDYAGAHFLPLSSVAAWAQAMARVAQQKKSYPPYREERTNEWEGLLAFCLDKAQEKGVMRASRRCRYS